MSKNIPQNNEIVVVGSSMFELIFKLRHIPEKGATVTAVNFDTGFGGKGANQACTIASLGGDVKILTCLGDDEYGKLTLQNYRKRSFNLKYIEIVKKQTSGIATIFLEGDGQNSIVVYQGANSFLNKKFIAKNKDIIYSAKIILTQLEIPLDSVEALSERKDNRENIFILNPSPIDETADYSRLLRNVDIIIPNELELSYITKLKIKNLKDIENAAGKLFKTGVKNIIVTLGSNGVFVKNDKIEEHVKPLPVKAVDTTGAGDVFAGAFTYFYSRSQDILKSAQYGNRMAALSVTRPGTQTSIPTSREIKEINKDFGILQ